MENYSPTSPVLWEQLYGDPRSQIVRVQVVLWLHIIRHTGHNIQPRSSTGVVQHNEQGCLSRTSQCSGSAGNGYHRLPAKGTIRPSMSKYLEGFTACEAEQLCFAMYRQLCLSNFFVAAVSA